MAKNRVIYQSDALYVSSGVNADAANEHKQLRRVQSANYSLNVTRQDVNQFGQLARIDSLILESPTVSFDASYLLSDGFNEQALGFKNSTGRNKGFISGQISSTSGRNFYIVTAAEGVDANTIATAGSGNSTIGIGNAFITDYTLDASVGDFPTVSISLEGTNMNGTVGVSGDSAGFSGIAGAGIEPASGTQINNQKFTLDSETLTGIQLPAAETATQDAAPTALRPGDITVTLNNADEKVILDVSGEGGAHVQSVSMSIPMSRTPIDRLGSKFAFARVVDFPITPTLSVSAIVSEVKTKALTEMIANDDFIDDIEIGFKEQDGSTEAVNFKLTKLKVDSESFSSSIGPNKSVDLTFSLTIGGPEDTTNNVFMSGSNTTAVFGNATD